MSRSSSNLVKVMAILNVTPDSFYADSRTFSVEEIENRVEQIVEQGADIIDVGGYSSRPGADDVSVEEEWCRVDRGISAVRKLAPEIAISLDTFRSEVARRALEKFGEITINDISAGEIDPELIMVVAKHQAPYIAMHMKGTPQTMQQQNHYFDVVQDVFEYFEQRVKYLNECGVRNVIIDPGFGFAKDINQNYQLLASMSKLKALGAPILVGISRKSMIYKVLDITAKESLTGTIALNWEAMRQGASIIRVHDVQEAVDIVKLHNKMITV